MRQNLLRTTALEQLRIPKKKGVPKIRNIALMYISLDVPFLKVILKIQNVTLKERIRFNCIKKSILF